MSTKPKQIDPQAERLYAAEAEFWATPSVLKWEDYFDNAERTATDGIQKTANFVQEVFDSEWMIKNFHGQWSIKIHPKLVLPSEIGGLIAKARAYNNHIVLTREGLCKFVVLHEIAHLLSNRGHGYLYNRSLVTGSKPKKRGDSGHGIVFASIQIALMHEFMGKLAAETLEAAFKRNKVRYIPLTTPEHYAKMRKEIR